MCFWLACVKKVVPTKPVWITEGAASGASKPIIVLPDQIFPLVEGFFGPLRVPLPRTGAVLDDEIRWDRGV